MDELIEEITSLLNSNHIHMFNYDEYVNKVVQLVVTTSSADEKEENLNTLSKFLHKYLWDIYEECMRDEQTWNNYFKETISRTINVVEVDVEKERGEEIAGRKIGRKSLD